MSALGVAGFAAARDDDFVAPPEADTQVLEKSGGPGRFFLPSRYLAVHRATMGFTRAEATLFDTLGHAGYVDYHLNASAIDDTYCADRLVEFETLQLTPKQGLSFDAWTFLTEPIAAYMTRHIYSKRQLQEVMVEFWTDHFNTFLWKAWRVFPSFHRDVIRRHALGNWRQMLFAVARHPAMLEYLDNTSNFWGRQNENFARELLELHTLSIEGGYPEADVFDVGRCFTGWTVNWNESSNTYGTFRYDNAGHDPYRKYLLGREIPAGGGIRDGETVLNILAFHPRTLNHLARKLCTKFVCYDPPQALVDQVAESLRTSNGDIKTVLRLILSPATLATFAKPKFKRPYHFVVSSVRGLNGFVGNMYDFWWEMINRTDQVPFYWPAPNGYPDRADAWMGSLQPRWYAAMHMPMNWLWSTRVDVFNGLRDRTPVGVVAHINRTLFGSALPDARRRQLRLFMSERPTNQEIRETIGLAMASPEFQYH
jgi:uncharacterized protein (DUF1800 family)